MLDSPLPRALARSRALAGGGIALALACAGPRRQPPSDPPGAGLGSGVALDDGDAGTGAAVAQTSAAGPPGYDPGTAPGLHVVYQGPDHEAQLPLMLEISLEDGPVAHRLSLLVDEVTTIDSCDSCTTTHLPAPPPSGYFKPGAVHAGALQLFPGAAPQAYARSRCADGFPLLERRHRAPGDYTVVVKGDALRCGAPRVRVPLVAPFVVTCER